MSADDQTAIKVSNKQADKLISKPIDNNKQFKENPFKEKHNLDHAKIISTALFVLETEAKAILDLTKQIKQEDKHYIAACKILIQCQGRVVVTGIGKSGHIGKKIAATLSSTGTPAIFLHPAEALHGDLGMIMKNDAVLALSNSGETEEILTLLPLIKRLQVPIITLTGNPNSTLSAISDVNLDVSIHQEACPLGLAPTASTTATLALGDALALSLLEARGFTKDDFAKSHPGGKLGRRLLLKIEDIMHKMDAIPKVSEMALLAEALVEMTQKRLGFTAIVSQEDPDRLVGIFTDGDVRRAFEQGLDIHKTVMHGIMSKNCKTITVGTLAADAITIMETPPKSFMLPVLDNAGKLVGALNMHDLFRAGIL